MVVVQHVEHEVHVIHDRPCAAHVTLGDGPNGVREESELAQHGGVDDDHFADVDRAFGCCH